MPRLRSSLQKLFPPLGGTALAVVLAALGAGCSATDENTTQIDFYGPAGLAVAPSRDRDLLFIASTGGDDLRAITICNTPSPDDGGAPVTTCADDEDFHFLPGPIRVFPGSFPVGNRPVRLAPVNLRDTSGNVVGGVLVAGVAALVDETGAVVDGGNADAGTVVALPALKLVDSVNLLDATQHAATLKEPSDIPLDAPPIDVVSLQLLTGTVPADGASQPSFVLTQANVASGVPAEITALSLAPSTNGPIASITGRCSLDILATRLALIPGQSSLLYVGDASQNAVAGGVGDGALEIVTASIPNATTGSVAPCPINRRLVATDPATGMARGLTSIALSPAYFTSDGRTYPAGAQMLGVSTDGLVVMIRTDLGVPEPIPPFTPLPDGGTIVAVIDGRTAYALPDGGVAPLLADGGFDTPLPGVTAQPMEPLRVNGFAREVSYMQTPISCPAGTDPTSPCVLIRAGASLGSYLSVNFALVGLVTATDGSVVFIDGDERRFINDNRDAVPSSSGVAASVTPPADFVPAQPNGQAAPTLNFANADGTTNGCATTVPLPTCRPVGWATAGVSRNATWTAIWHAQVPGLERQGGTLTREGETQMRFTMPGVDLTRWTNSALNDPLDVGDAVAFEAFSEADPTAPVCPELADENNDPLNREFVIAAIGPDYFILDASTQGVNDDDGGPGFNPPDDCLPVGGVAEVRFGDGLGGKPWLVAEGNLIHGRAGMCASLDGCDQMFVSSETRFDYPLQYLLDPTAVNLLPTIDNDVGVAFTITGEEPVTAQSTFSFPVVSGESPTRVTDSGALGGFAGAVISYTSIKLPGNLVFFSSTGSNSVLQIDPSLLGILNGVIAYR